MRKLPAEGRYLKEGWSKSEETRVCIKDKFHLFTLLPKADSATKI